MPTSKTFLNSAGLLWHVTLFFTITAPHVTTGNERHLEHLWQIPSATDLGLLPEDIPMECDCPINWNPVCGDDGHTYPNRCLLDCQNYSTRQKVAFVHYGNCQRKEL